VRKMSAHRGILTHDVHALDVSRENPLDDLHHREARLVVELRRRHPPRLCEARPRFRVVDPLIIGIHHRYQARIGCTLNIVLTPKRMQARPRLADLARHQGQGNETACIVGAVDMLADPHSPQDHRSGTRRV
jgi:hypothetical protein